MEFGRTGRVCSNLEVVRGSVSLGSTSAIGPSRRGCWKGFATGLGDAALSGILVCTVPEGATGTTVLPALAGRSPGRVFETSVRGARVPPVSPITLEGTAGICEVRRLVIERGLDATDVLLSLFAPPNLVASILTINSAFLRNSC